MPAFISCKATCAPAGTPTPTLTPTRMLAYAVPYIHACTRACMHIHGRGDTMCACNVQPCASRRASSVADIHV